MRFPTKRRYLTCSCFHRQPFLSSRHGPEWLAEAIETTRQNHPFQLWAYVFMPEHFHMLILPDPGVKVSAILRDLKPRVTNEVLRWVRRNKPSFLSRMADCRRNGKTFHRFWQRGGGYDRNTWTLDELYEKIEYIHANPVRRGLVEHPRDWHWSSWRAWHEDADGPIRIDKESLPPRETLGGLPRHGII